MMKYRAILLFLVACVIVHTYHSAQAAVVSVTGNTGGAQSGAITLSGGSSGASFDSATSTITQSFNFLSLPLTSATNGQIIVSGEPILHNYGPAAQNIFVGGSAGNFTLTGSENTGCGNSALSSITNGTQNTAIGDAALISLTQGNQNTTVGEFAGGSLVDGNGNVLIGVNAGSAYDSNESNNIIVGSSNPGIQGESDVIRIGTGGQQTACFIDGIFGATVSVDTGLGVFIDDSGKLGTITSSKRFKTNICDIGNDSANIFDLRPVAYVHKEDTKKMKQYGLIAEEVQDVFPELVVLQDGEPFAVKYNQLPVLLLNESKKMANHIEKLEKHIERLEHQIKSLERRISCQ